ncbi:MAG TPA: CsbD family protein [Bryobacteraceae bacterium]|nr:CsbD family protein [Bryobacteraceae bacterium]
MKSSTEDRIEGTVHEAKGAVKEKVGEVLHSPDLETEGKDEKLAGQVQQNVAQVKKLFKK